MAERSFFFDSHHRFLVALAAGAGALALSIHLPPSVRAILAWNVYALTSLALMWTAMLARHPEEIRRRGRLQDSSRTALFSAVVIGAVASLFAVAWLLRDTKGGSHQAAAILLSLATVGITWSLIHTLFALRYAQHFYANASRPLQFPGDQPPDYVDFAYFSFVIGMTFQVSDVQIARRDLRRLALIHGVIAFVFNSAIIAILVNVVAGAI